MQSYRIEGGQIHLKFKTKSGATGGPGVCSGTAESTFNAEAQEKYSALYFGEKGYLTTMVAPDCMMPQSSVTGTCRTPGATTPWSSPVNDNAIVILDRKGDYAGAVTGQATRSEGMGWTVTANWQFKPQ